MDMNYKQELLGLSYKKAKAIKAKIAELGVNKDTNVEELVTKLAKAKEQAGDGKWTTHLKGQEWYVNDLVAKSQMTNQELLESVYQDLLPANSSFEELVGML